MPLTTFRIYHAHVENWVDYYTITVYNKFNREVETIQVETREEVDERLKKFKEIEPQFTSNWSVS